MKKIISFLFLSIFALSCSDSSVSEINNSNSLSKLNVDLEPLYIDMIQSQSFIDSENSLHSFIAKMNFTGHVSDIDTQSKMFTWISTNILITDFDSFEEAETLWEEVKYFTQINIDQNDVFFQSLGSRNIEFHDLTMILDPIVPQPISAYGDCETQMQQCTSSSASTYTSAVSAAFFAAVNNEITGTEATQLIASARNVFSISMALCAEDYENCIMG